MAIETPTWDERVRDAFAHYKETHEIQDILLTRYDQHGMWIPVIWHEVVEDALIAELVRTVIPPERRENTNEAGERTLLCSFINHSEGTVDIPYHHVKGEIVVTEAETLNAPVLVSVGRRMVSICAIYFNIPKLQFAGSSIEAQSAYKFNAPNLQSVGGSLFVQIAQKVHAPKLQSVEGGLGAHFAEELHIPNLQFVGWDIEAQSALKFDAPHLQSVGRNLNAEAAVEFNAPKLQSVGENLIAFTAEVIDVPKLQSVGGSMYAGSATKLNAGVLKRVGGALNTRNAKDFYIRREYVGGDRELNSDAVNNWEAIRDAMKKQPELEI